MRLLPWLPTALAAVLFAQEGKFTPPEIVPRNFPFRGVLTRVSRLNLNADASVPVHEVLDRLSVGFKECHLRLTGFPFFIVYP
jgi:hypothetical protein